MKASNLKYSLFLIVLALWIFSCTSDDTTPEQNTNITATANTFGGSNNDSGQSVIATSDNGYAVLGFTQSNDLDITDKSDESFDYWILKFNAQDQLEWSKTYGGSSNDRGSSLIQTQDNGYALLGFTQSTDGDITQNQGSDDFWLVKLDPSGTIQWQKTYGFQGMDRGISIIQTNDQGFLIVGILDVTGSGGLGDTNFNRNFNANRHAGGDYWAIKVNSSGDLQWSRYFGGNNTDTPQDVIETDDNAFIIVGGSDSNDTDISNNIGTYDFWITKISNTGDLIWERSFGGSQIDEARGIIKTTDGNYIVSGDTRSDDNNISNNKGAADIWLIKISTNGDLLWEKTIGGTDFDVIRAMKSTSDGGIILSGSSRSGNGDVTENKGQNDALVLKTDSTGSLIWQTTLGGTNIDFAYDVVQLNNGRIIAVGDSTSSDGDINETNRGFTDLLTIQIN